LRLQDLSSPVPFFGLARRSTMQESKLGVFLVRLSLLIAALVILSGCSSLQGFGSLSDGAASTTEMRKAAALARAEADALDQIADQQSQGLQDALGASQGIAEALGAPEVVTALIAGVGGLLIPSPIRRKKPAFDSSQPEA